MGARRVLERADELARFTEEPGRITRPLASPSLAAAMDRVRAWMEDLGMETRSDALGNLAGRRGGPGQPLLIGSHLDTVADAGRYDGILGVLIGLAVVEALDPDTPVEVVAFADEEGLRFQSTFLGSRAFIGRLEPGELELRDPTGITLREAIGAEPGELDLRAPAGITPREAIGAEPGELDLRAPARITPREAIGAQLGEPLFEGAR